MTPRAYYNEWDSYAGDWLRNLIAAGHIAPGHVDGRSIRDVRPVDLDGFDRVHFFAGIGGWDLALQIAGWPAEAPVWTCSCPCQPWSKAGLGRGVDDDRHLWPEALRLIAECRPSVLFGEQVPVAIARGWLDTVASDLENIGYAFGAIRTRAADFGAPIERQRVWFTAVAVGAGMAGQFERGTAGATRPWGWRGEEDLRAVVDAPFVVGDRWPAPLVRRVDHGFPGTVGGMSAYGNAIVPQAGAAFVRAVKEALASHPPRSTGTTDADGSPRAGMGDR